jgi:hypothetical protein
MQRGFSAVSQKRIVKPGNQVEKEGPLVPCVLKKSHIRSIAPLVRKSAFVTTERAFAEKLDQKFLNSAPVIDTTTTSIFDLERAVLYRGADDALIAYRYLNTAGIQSVEIKYYNESSGLAHARPFLIDFQMVPGSELFASSLRRGPMIVGSNMFASLGVLHKENSAKGFFSFFMLIDAAISATPASAVNTKDVFIGEFDNIF